MPIPNLLHPVPIEIEQLDKGNTYYDDDAREPIQFAARKTKITVSGQVNWGAAMAADHERTGAVENASGYVLFRYVDLEAAGVVLQREDRFTSIGGVVTDVYVDRLVPRGHYPDIGGPTMVKAYFVDRQPARQQRG